MQFDRIRADFRSEFDLIDDRVQEQAHKNAGSLQLAHSVRNGVALRDRIQAAFGGDLFTPLRNQRRLLGADVTGDVQHFLIAGQFQVQLDRDRLAE